MHCCTNLYIRQLDESGGKERMERPIPGVGGSMLISTEKDGKRTDDEAYKKAYTDAQSVACKALGIGADVYWEKDTTKYDRPTAPSPAKPPAPAAGSPWKGLLTRAKRSLLSRQLTGARKNMAYPVHGMR